MILSVDIGGTKIAAAAVDSNGELVGDVLTTPTPAHADASTVLHETVGLLRSHPAQRVSAVAVSSAGVVDSAHGVVLAATDSIRGWAGAAIGPSLAQELGVPVQVIGDGQAFAVGEWAYGAGQGRGSLALLAVGTGIGGGFVIDGRPMQGSHYAGGHFGHVAVPQASGVRCPCGASGHAEAVGSGSGMLAQYHARGGAADVTSTAQLVSRTTDAVAVQVIENGAAAVGLVAAGLVNALDPDVVVVAGGVARAGGRWQEALDTAYRGSLMPVLANTPLRVSRSGPEMALRGAAHHTMRKVCDAVES